MNHGQTYVPNGPGPHATATAASKPGMAFRSWLPEVVLLFKSRSKSDKDRRDVETVMPVLSAEQRSWLQDTLEHLPRGQTAPVPRP